ncbi:hypothetical protein GINT2_001653 [Glugoides intestinalis]
MNNTKKSLMEMFPDLDEKKAELLTKTSDDINILITRILDNNIDPPTFDMKELCLGSRTRYVEKKNYNYQEAFESNIDMHVDIAYLRKQAAELNKEAAELSKQGVYHDIREARSHYIIEADERIEKAKELNRKAAIILMRRNLESTDAIDLHGFTADETVKFMDDLYLFKRFSKIKVVTGQRYNSLKIRPAVEEWFKRHGFDCYEQGPCVFAIKKPYICHYNNF